MSSKNIFGIINCFIPCFILLITFTKGVPITGILSKIFLPDLFDIVYTFLALSLLNSILIPPIFLDMLISLSFKTTITFVLELPI